jgi:hypothetical protein
MNRNLAAFILATAAAGALPAGAQEIYRCGDSYSQKPCPGGALVQAQDARSASQRVQTSQAAQRDAKAARALEKARLKEEAKPVAAYIPAPKAEAEADEKNAGARKPGKARKPEYFTAAAPRKPGEAATGKNKKAKKKES